MTREEAIKRIKARFDKLALDDKDTKAIQTLIPELRDNEDERIRKDIIALIKFGLTEGSAVSPGSHTTKEEALAYLEKQKEEKPVSYTPLCNTIKDKIREYVSNHFVTDTVVNTDVKSIVKAMEEGVRLGKESQKPVEWSEEDETALISIFYCISQAIKNVNDENERNSLLNAKSWIQDKLKFHIPSKISHPRPSWKPSKEQMDALERASTNKYLSAEQFDVLVSLCEQLKKLGVKEEPEYYQHFDPDC